MGRAATFVARWRVTILALAIAVTASVTWIGSAKADGPGSGTASVAVLGAHAYHDNEAHTAEVIAGCHRSLSAEIGIGGGVNSVNLRQAYNSGTPRGGTCTRTGTGLTAGGEPVMTLR